MVNADLSDPVNPVVVAALTHKCECEAAPDEHCHNTIDRKLPLPMGRLVHYMRVEQWDVGQ